MSSDETFFRINELKSSWNLTEPERQILFYIREKYSVGEMKEKISKMLEKLDINLELISYIKYENLQKYFDHYIKNLIKVEFISIST